MQAILNSYNLKNVLEGELNKVQGTLQIISAYCKQSALEFVDAKLPMLPIIKRLIVRFRADDILSGATDFSIYRYCKEHGWELYVLFDLHAKTYVFDKKRWIVGSANLTSSGIGLGSNGNKEMAIVVDVADDEYHKISEMFSSATQMTDQLAELMESQLLDRSSLKGGVIEWNNEIKSLLSSNITTLFTHDFPSTFSPFSIADSDFVLLGIECGASIERIKQAFLHCRCFQWLLTVLQSKPQQQEYFGGLSVDLHKAMLNDPKPYRQEIKKLLANLLNWIIELKIDSVIIEQPRYSQLVKLR